MERVAEVAPRYINQDSVPNMAKGIYTKLCKNVVHGQQDNGSQFNFGRSFKLWRHVGH